jgi:anti-anti-sigma factor
MTIYSEISNGILLMRPHQAIDHTSATDIHERINILADTDIDALVLDLSQTEHACASLLKIILDLTNRPAPIQVAIVGASQQFQNLMKLCGVNELVSQYPSVEEALGAFKRMRYSEPDEPYEFDDDGAQDESAASMNDDADEDWLVDEDD